MKIIDNRKRYRSNLDKNQIKVYQQLLDYHKENMSIPSQKQMAKDVFLSIKEITEILKSLEDRDYLKFSYAYDKNGKLNKICELFI